MTKDKMKEEIYRKLCYFFENKIPVHFKDLDGIFYNGYLVGLSIEQATIILDERIKGTMPILLECIDTNSITKFKEKKR